MSGGHFEYNQYRIQDIIDKLEENLALMGTEIPIETPWDREYYEKYPEQAVHYKYPDDIVEQFKQGLMYLKLAKIYTQRIDWLMSGDDGEKSFRERLKEDLEEITIDILKKLTQNKQ